MNNHSFIQTSDGINLAYECFGSYKNPAVIMIMGLGAQMRTWPDDLCQGIANHGYQVIRFDNRDVGYSSHLDEQGNPSLLRVWLQTKLNKKANTPYSLKDMSNDVLALMDELEIDSAHLVGASMGGMIAQVLASRKRKRVRSLVSIMSSASSPGINAPKLNVLLRLARRPQTSKPEQLMRYGMRLNRLIGSPDYQLDEVELKQQVEKSLHLPNNALGVKRQLLAVTAAGDRRDKLSKIKVPTLVIHGSEDPVIPVKMGVDTADNIKRSKLHIIQGMGHNLPPALVPTLQNMICEHLEKAEKRFQKKRLKKQQKKQQKELSLESSEAEIKTLSSSH